MVCLKVSDIFNTYISISWLVGTFRFRSSTNGVMLIGFILPPQVFGFIVGYRKLGIMGTEYSMLILQFLVND